MHRDADGGRAEEQQHTRTIATASAEHDVLGDRPPEEQVLKLDALPLAAPRLGCCNVANCVTKIYQLEVEPKHVDSSEPGCVDRKRPGT